MSHPRTAILVKLPRKTVAEIRRRAKKHSVPYWKVVEDAITLDTTAIMHPRPIGLSPAQIELLWNKAKAAQQIIDQKRFVRRDPIEVRVKK